MIFGDRLILTLTLRLEGQLHLGSGRRVPEPELQRSDMPDPPELALVQRDRADQPIIPATALKGALRAAAAATLDPATLDMLLGQQGEASEGRGRIARLWLGTATATTPSDENAAYAGATQGRGLRPHGFVKTGVQIDRASGAAEDRKLYQKEVVGDGIVFTTEAILFLDEVEDEAVLLDDVARLLAPLAAASGLSAGAQRRQAAGRLRLLEEGLKIASRRIDPHTLELVENEDEPELARALWAKASQEPALAATAPVRLRLTCEGPFISMRDKLPENGGPEITRPLERDQRPLLWPSSLLGALRSRAAWLAALAVRRGDDRFAVGREPHDVDRRHEAVRRKSELAALSSVERLFGVAGWRGLLVVETLAPDPDATPRRKCLTSVSIDRFTGGAMDQRLFTEETFLGAGFLADLRLEQRAGYPTDPDRELLRSLLADLGRTGLELGHGAAKGFGWFEVSGTTATGASP